MLCAYCDKRHVGKKDSIFCSKCETSAVNKNIKSDFEKPQDKNLETKILKYLKTKEPWF